MPDRESKAPKSLWAWRPYDWGYVAAAFCALMRNFCGMWLACELLA